MSDDRPPVPPAPPLPFPVPDSAPKPEPKFLAIQPAATKTTHPAEHFSIYFSAEPDNMPIEGDPLVVYVSLKTDCVLRIDRETGEIVLFEGWDNKTRTPFGHGTTIRH